MLLPVSAYTKGILWFVLFGLAKTFQYAGLTIIGVEGFKRLKQKLKRTK
jgi:phosphoglycolate phosphatase